MKKIHYSWFVCLGCALILFCTSGLAVNAFTIYQPYILVQNGFTNTQSSTIITVRSLTSFLSMFLTGPFYKKVPLRIGLSLSGLIIAAGFFLFGLAGSFAAYCAAAAVTGLGYGLGTMIPIAMLLERWFTQKRTLAIGLCTSVTGLSTLGIPSLIIRLIGQFGLARTFMLEAAAIGVLSLISFLLLRSDPKQMGLDPCGGERCADARVREARNAGLKKGDWLLIVPMLLLLGAMTNTGYSHLSVLMTANGLPAETAALAVSVSGLTLVIAKCLFGALSERLTVPRCNQLFGSAGITGLALLCVPSGSVLLPLVGVFLYSIGLAMTTVGFTAWAGDWSTPEQYDAAVRRFQIGYAAGCLLFSSLPGILADRHGGSYIPAYMFFTFCAAAVLITAQVIYKKQCGPRTTHRRPCLPARVPHVSHSHNG